MEPKQLPILNPYNESDQLNHFANLPTEILLKISAYLDSTDLSSLRCTNKQWANIAANSLFEHLHVKITLKSLTNLLKIARHSRLAQHVRSIDYDGGVLQELLFVNFETRLLHASNRHVYPSINNGIYPTLTPQHEEALATATATAWETYHEAYKEQNRIREQHHNISMLREALPLLSNLAMLNIIVSSRNPPNGDTLVQRSEYMPGVGLVDFVDVDEDGNVVKDTLVAMSSAVESCERLEKLQASYVTWHSFDPDIVGVYHPVFCKLRMLSLDFDLDFGVTAPDRFAHLYQVAFARTLKLTPKMEELHLSFDNSVRSITDLGSRLHEGTVIVDLKIILPVTPNSFSRLKSLSLGHITSSAAAMGVFLSNHVGTLRNLRIVNLQVPLSEDQCTFDDFYSYFQQGLDLETIELRGIWYISNLTDPIIYVADMSETFVEALEQWILSKSQLPLSMVTPKVVVVDLDESDSEDDDWGDHLVPPTEGDADNEDG